MTTLDEFATTSRIATRTSDPSSGPRAIDVVDRSAAPRSVAVVGTGYVGLTTGACLADLGHEVTCADVDVAKVDALQAGRIPIHEQGLDAIVASSRTAGRLSFVLGAESAARTADAVFLCLPTPQGESGGADLTCLLDVARSIGPHLRPGAVVVNKSTVPVGTAAAVARCLGRDDVDVVSNPEFLREGSAVSDFLQPDRIVIGADHPATGAWLARLYASVDADVLITSTEAAETIKYIANGFLAMKISFANAVAAFCEAVGANVDEVMRGVGSDQRIGHQFLQPGPGWGGSCFPKDSRALVSAGDAHGYDFEMIRVAIAVNEQQQARMVGKVHDAVGRTIDDPRRLDGVNVGVLGLTFKAHTDDLRESPAVSIAHRLVQAGADVIAFDPTTCGPLDAAKRAHLGTLRLAANPRDVASDADVVVVLTEWPEFRTVPDRAFASAMRGNTLVDGRNLLDRGDVERLGLRYVGIGR
jgi:UDPglucose 6-dehydrogenase